MKIGQQSHKKNILYKDMQDNAAMILKSIKVKNSSSNVTTTKDFSTEPRFEIYRQIVANVTKSIQFSTLLSLTMNMTSVLTMSTFEIVQSSLK